MKRVITKKILKILGNIFTLAAVFYLLATIAGNIHKIKIVYSSALVLVIVLFCATGLIQALIIRLLLGRGLRYLALLKINSASQVYKYMPGNIAHYVSRWIYLREHGVCAHDNVMLIASETLLLVVAFGLYGIIFLAVSPLMDVGLPRGHYQLIISMSAGCLVLVGFFFRKKIAEILTAKAILVIMLYAFSGLLSGVILCILSAYMVAEISGIGFMQYTLGFAVSFLVGFVVPGSPGGIGIREVVFVELFRHSGNAPYLLTQVIMYYRLLSIAAELLMLCATKIFIREPV